MSVDKNKNKNKEKDKTKAPGNNNDLEGNDKPPAKSRTKPKKLRSMI